MYVLKLNKVRSFRGEVFASQDKPEIKIADAAIAERLVATGYFDQVAVVDQTPSAFARDPSSIGGPNCHVKLYHNSADVSGIIAWYEADEDLGRTEGCRAGFQIEAPEGQDVTGATYTYNGQTGLVEEDTAKDPRRLLWYPLVEEDTAERSITVNWCPGSSREDEVFTVRFHDFQLQPKPQTEKEKLLVLLDSMRNINELKAYAEKEEIDLGGAIKRADIIAAIVAAKFPDAPDPFQTETPSAAGEEPEADPTEVDEDDHDETNQPDAPGSE